MHNNSLEAYKSIMHSGSKTERARAVLLIFKRNKKPMTDRDILRGFNETSDDLNLVRPRISELHFQGILAESDPVFDPRTGRTVRTSFIREGVKPVMYK